jgi:hypothetical protein
MKMRLLVCIVAPSLLCEHVKKIIIIISLKKSLKK